MKISKGDYIHLCDWQELCELGEVDKEGNITLPNSYRLFLSEAELYGKWYKVISISKSYMYKNHIYNCIGKREICELEIDKVARHGTKIYQRLESLFNEIE